MQPLQFGANGAHAKCSKKTSALVLRVWSHLVFVQFSKMFFCLNPHFRKLSKNGQTRRRWPSIMSAGRVACCSLCHVILCNLFRTFTTSHTETSRWNTPQRHRTTCSSGCCFVDYKKSYHHVIFSNCFGATCADMLPALQRCKYATKFNRSIMETNSLGTMTRLLWAWFLNGVSFKMTHLLRWNVMTITPPWATMVHARINQNRSHWKTLNSHSKQNYRNCFFSQKVDIVMKTQIFFFYEYEGTPNPTWLQVWAWLQYLSMWWTYPLILQSDVTHWNWMTHCHYMSLFLRRFSQNRFISNNFSIPRIC